MDNYIIELFNPKDKLFGKLSNHSYHPLVINGKKYSTVTNYIYSNMLTTPMYKQDIRLADIKGSTKLNLELMKAIDYLIDKQKPDRPETKLLIKKRPLTSIAERVRNKRIKFLADKTGKSRDHYQQYTDTELAKKYKEYNPEKPITDTEIQQGWIAYAQTEEIRAITKEDKLAKKHQMYISNEVRKPFGSIDLKKLKQQLLIESDINQMSIYQLYNNRAHRETIDILTVAIKKAFESRIQNPTITGMLLATGNNFIQYNSPDPFMGIGEHGQGLNLIGKILMQIRHAIHIEKSMEKQKTKREQEYQEIYNTYIAYNILKNEIRYNKNTLKEYQGMNVKQIITKAPKNAITDIPSQETVIELYKKDQLNPIIIQEISTPGTLVINVRKNELKNLQRQLERDKEDIIFNLYIEYKIKRDDEENLEKETNKLLDIQEKTNKHGRKKSKSEITDEVVQYIVAKQKDKLTGIQEQQLRHKIVNLFNLGMLSASLSDKIDKRINELQIPTDADVKEAEMAEIPVLKHTTPIKDDISEHSAVVSSLSLSSDSDSDDDDPEVREIKRIFAQDKKKNKTPLSSKLSRKDMIDVIIKIKGHGHPSDFNDWSTNNLKQTMEELSVEHTKNKPSIEGGIYIKPSKITINIFQNPDKNPPELRAFSPEEFTGMLIIDGRYYPTVQHYILAVLIAHTGARRVVNILGEASIVKGVGINEAHKIIMNDFKNNPTLPQSYLPIEILGNKYKQIDDETRNTLLSIYTVTALNRKFEDIDMQNLLLSTRNYQILWKSPENLFLGAGTKDNPGNNYVGKTLMDIRRKLLETKRTEEAVRADPKDIARILQKDIFIKEWIQMKIRDMCDVTYKFQQYSKMKDGVDINIVDTLQLKQYIQFVLNHIYQPCTYLVSKSKKAISKVPTFFVHWVRKCKGLSSGLPPVRNSDGTYNTEISERIRETNRRIYEMDNEFYGGRQIEHSLEESTAFNKHQKEAWQKLWQTLNQSDMSHQDKQNQAQLFRKTQQIEYNAFWGIKDIKRTKAEIAQHEHLVGKYDQQGNRVGGQLRKDLTTYIRKAEQAEHSHYLSVVEIAQIYWNHISAMMETIIINLAITPRGANDATLRDVIAQTELIVSENVDCIRIITKEPNNCIASALLNLLTGILEFKTKYSNNIILDTDDVLLAGSIITNSPFTAEHKFVVKESDSDDSDSKVESNFDVSIQGSFPEDFEKQDEDKNDKNQDPYAVNPYFSFKGKHKNISSSIDAIEQQVRKIQPDNSRVIANAIIKMIQTVKRTKMSAKIKKNRINFFATVR